MLGVGGTRQHLGREALRGGRDGRARKRELPRGLQERREQGRERREGHEGGEERGAGGQA
ncbi:hypothetical protein SAMN05216505_101703 [Streptomyces prasinopilosus]|uniref:Uncharacterized protein n=2 Tax=Streptomyces prasinopilosus TaxID=67344 RepID=A0A1G6JJF1_9ACTN|nr:hypothetical protein SAMN05216505_101703 [Streptomyces prasinopilosus]